jgi:hypothetical protein
MSLLSFAHSGRYSITIFLLLFSFITAVQEFEVTTKSSKNKKKFIQSALVKKVKMNSAATVWIVNSPAVNIETLLTK